MFLSRHAARQGRDVSHGPLLLRLITAKITLPRDFGCHPQWTDSASTICSPRPRSLVADACRLMRSSRDESDTMTATAADQVQLMMVGRRDKHAGHKPHRARHPYGLRGCVWCGLCERRMQGHWVNSTPYYRCRFPAEYALANHVGHPLSVNLREDAIIGQVDDWLACEFAPHRLSDIIHDLVSAQQTAARREEHHEEAAAKIAEYDRKLAQYRAALDAGADPAAVAAWITDTEAEKARHELGRRQPAVSQRRMSETEIKAIIARLTDLARVLHDADPDDKAEVSRQLGLRLTYHPGRKLVEAKVIPTRFWVFRQCPRGDLNPETREISPIRGNFHGPSITAGARRRQEFRVPSASQVRRPMSEQGHAGAARRSPGGHALCCP